MKQTEETTKQKQERKQYAKRGERDSKMVAFRADGDVIKYLERAANKGRLINELVKKWARAQEWYDPDTSPDENLIEETMK